MQAGQPINFTPATSANRKIVDLEIIETSDAALTIGGQSLNLNSTQDATFTGPKLVINGNVDIQGTLNSISSTQVTFDDSTILLNSNKPSEEAAANSDPDAGFEVNRGANTNVSFLWNETSDNWLLTGGPLNMGSLKITNLATPTAATDAATMGYVDDANTAMTTFVTDSIATANSAMTTYVDGKFGSVDLSTCAIKSETNTFTADQTISGDLIVDGKIINSRPADMWSGGATGEDHISFGDIGRIYHAGNYRISLTSNGYRDNNNLWQRDIATGLNGSTGAAQISLDPNGHIFFETEANKAVGADAAIARRMTVTGEGKVGIGTSSPVRELDVKGNVRINNDSYSRLEWYNDSDEIDPTDFWIAEHHNNGDFRLMRRDVDAGTWGSNLVLAADGNIGVGKTDPSERLEVNGNIKATNMLIGTEQVLHTGNLPVTAAKDENGDTVYTFDALP